MDPTDHRQLHTAQPLRALAFGLLAGACLGVLEVTVRAWDNADPSIARRLPELWIYAATWYGLAGAVCGWAAGLVARTGERFGWKSAREGPQALILGSFFAVLVPAGLLLGLVHRMHRQPPATRVMLVALLGVLSVLCGWFVARRLAARPGGALAVRARLLYAPRVILVILLLSSAFAGLRLLPRQTELGARGVPQASAAAGSPNVLLILVDTLRADALGCYGAERPTPTFDGLAARGALFESALAPSSWTLPSVATLFTSTPPWAHGCTNFNTPIAELDSLAGAFSDAGYECLAAVGNPFVNRAAGYDRGFHVYDVDSQALEERLFSSRLFDGLLRLAGRIHGPRVILPWLEAGRFPPLTTRLGSYLLDEDLIANVERHAWPSGDRPFFLYVQLVAPHTPYLEHPLAFLKNQPELVEENLDALRQRYADEVQYTDAQIAHLLDGLERDGLLEETLVVITSDHGEEFLEHGDFEHGYSLYGEVVEIPLILAGPGVPPGVRVQENAQLMDLGPTLLELAGREAPRSFLGRSLVGKLVDETPLDERVVFCETGPSFLTPEHRIFSATKGKRRIIRKRTLEDVLVSEEAFDLGTDPGETRPLEVSSAFADLAAALDGYEDIERTVAGEGPALHDPGQMKDLGYFGDDDQ